MALFGYDLASGTSNADRATFRLVGAGVLWEAVKLLKLSAEQQMQLNGYLKGIGPKK